MFAESMPISSNMVHDRDHDHDHPSPDDIDPNNFSASTDDFSGPRNSSFSAYDVNRLSCEGSPLMMSPWNQPSAFPATMLQQNQPQNSLIGSLVREEGHIYSLAAKNEILYTGSDSKNIRVWKNMQEFSAFKSNSGLVKAIIIAGDKIFTGHQDGKIRIWKINSKKPSVYRRSGTVPTFFDIFKASMKPSNYVEVKRHSKALWIKHVDAISCLSMDQESGLLYSASWDRTFKVWRVEGAKCIESVKAHDDAVNSIVSSSEGIVYTGSADGSVKMWKREQRGKVVRHSLVQTLLSQECAVTAVTIGGLGGSVVYAGSSDGVVNFWEREKEEVRHGGVLKGHKLAVLCLAAAGNNLVFSGSADKTICVWRKVGPVHSCLSVLTGHAGPVKCLAVDEDKGGEKKWVVYSGSLDKSVKVWSVSEMAPEMGQIGAGMQLGHGDSNWESIPSAKY